MIKTTKSIEKVKSEYDKLRKKIRATVESERRTDRLMISLFYNVALKEIPEFIIILKEHPSTAHLSATRMLSSACTIGKKAEKAMRSGSYKKIALGVHKDEQKERAEIESIFNYMEQTILSCACAGAHLDKNCITGQINALLASCEDIKFYDGMVAIKKLFVDDLKKSCQNAKTDEERLIDLLIGSSLRHYLRRFYTEFLVGATPTE